ncbi:LOB domain-containing protein 39 [Selaginella moellendorffii]|uniref:LOB domain-containing protein 39 n=1 Tax=Selaginella moellendorffii TaxID=88036 RepID=UPI000D1CEDBD|nr:LOB domain-containing protein 39 [Selaginella moellendorffii]|eukprot:XP_002976218.2 LOB domain-containing protein 39 [Selaginella moellendorffii]
MSCNGCRVLRKGCSDSCILRPCLQWIEGPEAQGHATVFVAKFFGRAGLMNFISAVPENQRPALFQSLLYEACGRTVNPVFGAVGLLWSGSWHVCQAAVETVLKGGSLQALKQPGSSSMSGAATAAAAANAGATTLFHRHHHHQTPGTRSPTSVLVDAMESHKPLQQPGSGRYVERSQRPLEVGIDHREQQSGVKREFEIVAPVPRRIRPRQQQLQEDRHPGLSVDDHQVLDLDLTLGSTPKHQHEEEQRALTMVETKRVHSPCQSITSEGSVTSVDTADLKISLRHERAAPARSLST